MAQANLTQIDTPLPRKGGLSCSTSGNLHSKFAGLRVGPATAGGAFPAFMRTRYSGWAVSTTGGRMKSRAPQVAKTGEASAAV